MSFTLFLLLLASCAVQPQKIKQPPLAEPALGTTVASSPAPVLNAREANPDDERFIEAMRKPDLEIVRQMVAEGFDINNIQWYRTPSTAFNAAIQINASTNVLNALKTAGADFNEKDGYSRNRGLAHAIQTVNLELADYFLNNGVDLNARDVFYATPLSYAATTIRDPRMFELLIKHGADPDTQDENGCTPLMNALTRMDFKNDAQHIKNLLATGTNPALRNHYGGDALDVAAQSRASAEVLHILWDAIEAADPARLNDYAQLALRVARHKPGALQDMLDARVSQHLPRDRTAHYWKPPSQKARMLIKLLEAGVAPDTRDNAGNTLLYMACWDADPDPVEELIRNKPKADVNAANHRGWTPLMNAAQHASHATVALLLNAGADIHAKSETGFTALHCAALNHAHPANALSLLRAGADIHAKNQSGDTPLLLLRSAAPNLVQPASPDILWLLLTFGADVHARNHKGRGALTGIHFARPPYPPYPGHADSVRLLLDAGINRSLTPEERGKVLAFAFLARLDEKYALELLREKVDTRVVLNSWRPLELAIRNNATVAVIQKILAHKPPLRDAVDPGAVDNAMRPLEYHEIPVRKNTSPDYNENLPLGLALKRNDPEITGLLLKTDIDLIRFSKVPEILALSFPAVDGLLTPEFVTRLHNAGVRLDVREKETGKTFFMLVAEHCADPKLITTLLELGLDPHTRDNAEKTALDYLNANPRLNKTRAVSALKKAR